MYHFIYETTNKINGKKYIGKHSTNDMDDGYLGSGIVLINAIKKYGKENFERQIIEICNNEVLLSELEKKYVTEEIVASDLYYNIALGGCGGNIVLYPEHPLYDEVCRKISESKLTDEYREYNSKFTKENHKQKRVGMYGKTQSDKQKEVARNNLLGKKLDKERVEKQKESYRKTVDDPNYMHPNKGKKFDEERKKRMSEATKNSPKKTCPHCGKTLDSRNYARYHGDKCKKKE